MKKKRVFVRLGQGLSRAKEAQALQEAAKAAGRQAAPAQGDAPAAGSVPPPAQGMMPHGQGTQPSAQGAPLYMQPLYMPYVQPPAADGGAQQPEQFVPGLQNMSNVRGMPSVQGVPFLMCVPDAQGRPQWVPVVAFFASPPV